MTYMATALEWLLRLEYNRIIYSIGNRSMLIKQQAYAICSVPLLELNISHDGMKLCLTSGSLLHFSKKMHMVSVVAGEQEKS